MNTKSVTQKIEAKNKAFNKALEKAENDDTRVFFNAELNEGLARGVQMDIIKSNIGTKTGRKTLTEIATIKLDHQGKDSVDSFIRHMGKLVREGVVKQPKENGEAISLKNNKKGIGWSKQRATTTKDDTKADTTTEQVDAKKVKKDIIKLLKTLTLAESVTMLSELQAEFGADKITASLGGAGAKPKAKTKKVA